MREVSTETNGRYTEIYINGIEDGSIAFDAKTDQLMLLGEIELDNQDVLSDKNLINVTLPEE